MLPYWILIAVPTFFALLATGARLNRTSNSILFLLVGLLLVLFKGGRYDVGADWGAYLRHYETARSQDIVEIITATDPAYYLINWIAALFNWDIFFVNTVCASFVVWALLTFCRRQPLPWLALIAAVPYFYVVITFGYVRQGVAASLLLLAILHLEKEQNYRFLLWVGAASAFHFSALIAAPLVLLALKKGRILVVAPLAIILTLGALLLLWEPFVTVWGYYIERGMESEGALIRGLMNGMVAAVFIAYGQRLSDSAHQARVWRTISFVSIIMLVALFSTPEGVTTAVDRVAVYLTPLQVFVLARIHRIATGSVEVKAGFFIGIIMLYYLIYFVWLNYAANSQHWVPYQNILYLN